MPTVAWGLGEAVAPTEIIRILNGTGSYAGYVWDTSTAGVPSKPTLNEANGIRTESSRDPLRFDLSQSDNGVIVARSGNPVLTEEPIGNWNYVNRMYNVELEVYTNENKQHLFNLVREVRRICHKNRTAPSVSGFQRVQFVNFIPETENAVNVWYGTVNIQLVNLSVLMEDTWS